MRAGQARRKWSTGLTGQCSKGRPCACARRAGGDACKSRQAFLPVPKRAGGNRLPLEYRPCGLGVHGRPGGKWSTGLTGQCSLQGRQECLPYLRQEYLPYLNADSECSVPSVPSVCSVPSESSVLSVDSEFSEEFCCPRNLREGQSGRRAFVKLTGKRGGKKKLFLQNKPISKLPISS